MTSTPTGWTLTDEGTIDGVQHVTVLDEGANPVEYNITAGEARDRYGLELDEGPHGDGITDEEADEILAAIAENDEPEEVSGTFTLTFDLGNAAFQDDCWEEIGKILAVVRAQVTTNGYLTNEERWVRDGNGNKVGHWVVKP